MKNLNFLCVFRVSDLKEKVVKTTKPKATKSTEARGERERERERNERDTDKRNVCSDLVG